MERIEDFAALSPLLTAQLKPGVYTNHLMAPGDYDREIAAGLTVFPFPGGLWLRRSRAGHGLYTFYWQRGAELCPPPAAEAAVTEIVWRPGKEARPWRPWPGWRKPDGGCSSAGAAGSGPPVPPKGRGHTAALTRRRQTPCWPSSGNSSTR